LLSQISSGTKPLNGDATVRGVYINSGSKDAGLDPDAAKYRSRKAM
jgi:hypothetical protein